LKRRDVPGQILSAETIQVLQAYDWLGNVREMANALEHAVILAGGDPLLPEHLPASVTRAIEAESRGETLVMPTSPKTLREIEMGVIYQVLDKHKGDKPKAAAELGIALKTLYNKLNSDQSRAAG
jgi:DNA-binding NtrC family response regulator